MDMNIKEAKQMIWIHQQCFSIYIYNNIESEIFE